MWRALQVEVGSVGTEHGIFVAAAKPREGAHGVSTWTFGAYQPGRMVATVCQANRALVWGSEKQARKDF